MISFATDLSIRLTEKKAFWRDYSSLRTVGVRGSVGPVKFRGDLHPAEGAITRLLYTASVLCQSEREHDLALAQSIALSALFVSRTPSIVNSSTSILAQLGNFPGLNFVRNSFGEVEAPLLNELQIDLLSSLNTVDAIDSQRALTDFQLQVWNSLATTRASSISAPTSAGKSFVVIEYLCARVASSSALTVIYVAPTRALLSEVSKKLSERLAGLPDVRVCTVPAVDGDGRAKQVYVLTQERLSTLLSISDLHTDLMIIDEAQNLADGARGMILQDCIERVRALSPAAQLLLLSPGATGFPATMATAGIQHLEVQETLLSPVLQNRIVVTALEGRPFELELSLLERSEQTPIGIIEVKRGVSSPETRLATVALELGSEVGNLVYATGPADAELVARRLVLGLEVQDSESLRDLSAFIKDHIHKDYGLADLVLRGVAFHYGKMPALLREAIEGSFQRGDLRYLVCTTTLFQGVNLPARNVFINTPTRGSGTALDPALIWNFAGRAGRLSQDIVGNVFLVDYNSWMSKPLDQHVRIQVRSSLADSIAQYSGEIAEVLSQDLVRPKISRESAEVVNGAVGLLLSRASQGVVNGVLGRVPSLDPELKVSIAELATTAVERISLPSNVLQNNWTVDPFGLSRLRLALEQRVRDGGIEQVLPCDPRDSRAFKVYTVIFNLIGSEVLGWNVSKLGAFVSGYALQWMIGTPYPVLVAKWVKRKEKERKRPAKGVDGDIRTAFDFIEDDLRFNWVQRGKAYVDVLKHVLEGAGLSSRTSAIYDFSLALEMGVASKSARSFIEVGLSRITAAALAGLYPDSELSVEDARGVIKNIDLNVLSLSPVLVMEIQSMRNMS